MTELPRDLTDLRLAPVALELNASIERLGRLTAEELAFEIALEGDRPDYSPEFRAEGLLRAVSRFVDITGWELSLEERGIRLRHGRHSLVLGIPGSFRGYVGELPPPAPLRTDRDGEVPKSPATTWEQATILGMGLVR